MQLVLRWLLSGAALYITVFTGKALGLPFYLASGLSGAEGALIFVVILAVVNAVIRPIAQFLAFPLTCLTFGLFAFVVNALLFWAAGQITPVFHVRGVFAPLFGSVVMGLVSGALNNMLVSNAEKKRR